MNIFDKFFKSKKNISEQSSQIKHGINSTKLTFNDIDSEFFPYACHLNKNTVLTKNGHIFGNSGYSVARKLLHRCSQRLGREALATHVVPPSLAIQIYRSARCKPTGIRLFGGCWPISGCCRYQKSLTRSAPAHQSNSASSPPTKITSKTC